MNVDFQRIWNLPRTCWFPDAMPFRSNGDSDVICSLGKPPATTTAPALASGPLRCSIGGANLVAYLTSSSLCHIYHLNLLNTSADCVSSQSHSSRSYIATFRSSRLQSSLSPRGQYPSSGTMSFINNAPISVAAPLLAPLGMC